MIHPLNGVKTYAKMLAEYAADISAEYGTVLHGGFSDSIMARKVRQARDALDAIEASIEEHRALVANRQPIAKPEADREAIIEECAVAAEAQDREGREWVRDSLWANILKRAGANVRALKHHAESAK